MHWQMSFIGGRPNCDHFRQHRNPEQQFQSFFQKPSFRPLAAAPDGGSLQRRV